MDVLFLCFLEKYLYVFCIMVIVMVDVPCCGRCGGRMTWYVDTLLCPLCDSRLFEELWYGYQVRSGRYEQK